MKDEFKRLLADLTAQLPASARTPTWGDIVGALYVDAHKRPDHIDRLREALEEYFELKRT